MKLLLLILVLPLFCLGQNVNIPNANFKAYLVGNTAINTNGDNEIQVNEASVFNGDINVAGQEITDLTGIEAFVSITTLNCSNNYSVFGTITSLDVSACSALTTLDCSNNVYLFNLNLSGCTSLTTLNCGNNALSNLNLTACTALTTLNCGGNYLTSLDLSACTSLAYFSCYWNQLTSLDVRNGNNTNFVNFSTGANPYLYCISVDNPTWSTTNWVYIDLQHYFSNTCIRVGLSDINESNNLILYPNPTNGDFTITGLELVGTVSSLSLTDMNGKVVKVLDTKATKFSMASIKPGVYFLNIISGNKQEVLNIVKE